MTRPQSTKVDPGRRIGQLRSQAQTWLKYAKLSVAPVDLFALVPDRKLVDVRAKNLRGECDGLLRWVESKKRFYLFYDDSTSSRGRTRFNLAHELAHLLIDEHCSAIRRGDGVHRSKAEGFIGNRVMEREADIAASELLIPTFMMPTSDPTMATVLGISERFDSSLTCAAWAIIDRTSVPAAIILSKDGAVLWHRCNAALVEECGTWGLSAGRQVPGNSPTGRSLAAPGTTITGHSQVTAWFDQGSEEFWEEAFTPFGGQLTLTVVSR